MKVARGRSWQPEIGMEHASRGRRSGNKGVGARWRGRFRIFSARHRSRTEVSHAENSGMTMLFLTSSVPPTPQIGGGRIRCAGRPREWSFGAVPPQERWHEGLGFFLAWGILSHARSLGTTQRGGALLLFVLRACCGGMCWPVDRPATHAAAGAAARGALIFCFGGFFHTLRSGHAAPCHHGSGWHEGVSFCFSLAVAPVSEGDSFTRSELGNNTMTMGGCCCRLD